MKLPISYGCTSGSRDGIVGGTCFIARGLLSPSPQVLETAAWSVGPRRITWDALRITWDVLWNVLAGANTGARVVRIPHRLVLRVLRSVWISCAGLIGTGSCGECGP
jgi:hypothetical protein